jgi:hypothetical protein
MSLISKKYTILMNKEPLEVWINGGEVKSARFMGKRVQLSLDSEAIKLIKDNPTRYVNGSNLTDNLNFTQNVSKMMSSKLEYAMATGDKKTLSRFARSDLVPENQKNDFIAGINRPNGLRGILTRAVNNTNAIFQNLAKKIDRFFDKVSDRVANKKLDPYLSEYQLKYVNRAPPLSSEDFQKHLDPKLMQAAEQFYKDNGFSSSKSLKFKSVDDKIKLNQFLETALQKGHSLADANAAIHKVKQQAYLEGFESYYNDYRNEEKKGFESTIKDLEKKLHVYELKEASKNETIEDFKTLSKSIDQSDRIDILIKNKEYQRMPEEQKRKVEDSHIFNPEPILQRAQELARYTRSRAVCYSYR